MATAEELLAEFTQVDKTLVISNDLRTITIPPTVPNLGVESDNEVLRLNFKMPRHIGDIDLSTFTIRINSLNAKDEGDVYTVTDASVTDDDISFSWLVGPSATRYKGDTKFNVCMVVFASDGMHVMQEFNTAPATLKVLEGLEVDESLLDAGYAEGFTDGGAQLNEFRMAFWTSLRDDPYAASGKFAFYNEDMIKAVLPVPPDEFFREGENGMPPFQVEVSADYMFYYCDYPGAYRDSGLPSFNPNIYISAAEYMFSHSTFTEIPAISLAYCRSNFTFSSAKCRVIKGLCVNAVTHLGTEAFYDCTELESIDFVSGAICESWNLQWSTKLTPNTLRMIIDALCVVAEYNDAYAEDYGLLTNPTLTLAKACQEKMESTLLNGSTLPAVASQKGWTVVYA